MLFKKKKLNFAERWGLSSQPADPESWRNDRCDAEYWKVRAGLSQLQKQQAELSSQGVSSEIITESGELKLKVFRD